MRRLFCAICFCSFLLFPDIRPCLAGNEAFAVKKQPELQQIRPKKPVRIKLKRSAKDEYTWELAGDDVDELIRTDRKLRKQLNIQ